MRRTAFLLASLFLAAAASPADPERLHAPADVNESLEPAAAAATRPDLQPGWRFTVIRAGSLVGTVSIDGQAYPLSSSADIEFTEEVIRTEAGQPTELLREVTRVRVLDLDPETSRVVVREAVPAGQRFRLLLSPAGARLHDALTGEPAWDDELNRMFSMPTLLDLWPTDRPLAVGQRWSYGGTELTRRLLFIAAEGGQLDLEVERIAPDPDTGLETATIRGHLRTGIPISIVPLDYDAEVRMEVPLAIGVPSQIRFEGVLSATWVEEDEQGKPVQISMSAQGKGLQLCKPSEEVLETLRRPTS